MKIWRAEAGFGHSFVTEDKLYVRRMDVGLVRMEDDSLRLAPGGELFAYINIPVSLPFPDAKRAVEVASREFGGQALNIKYGATDKQRLIKTSAHGLFVYDGVSFQPFKTEADAFLLKNKVTCGAVLAAALMPIRFP